VARASLPIRALSHEQRARLWQRFTSEPFPETIRSWALHPAELKAAAQVAHIGEQAVLEACRSM
jgi:hypothetical protein